MTMVIKFKTGRLLISDNPKTLEVDGDLAECIKRIKEQDLPIKNNGEIIGTGSQVYSIEIIF